MSESQNKYDEGISAVVPVFGSAGTIETMVDRVSAALAANGQTYELILVNDGSTDRSWETITRLARSRPWLRGISLMRNYGQHNALLCGVRAARFDKIVTLDDDRGFFGLYYAFPLMSQAALEKAPDLMEHLARLDGRIDQATISEAVAEATDRGLNTIDLSPLQEGELHRLAGELLDRVLAG